MTFDICSCCGIESGYSEVYDVRFGVTATPYLFIETAFQLYWKHGFEERIFSGGIISFWTFFYINGFYEE
ncbi:MULTISPECIES: hypothetical protein [Bacillus]|jgi:hypothetical protein|uniref:hypothetical protein n=1 Tax=Bacillus TaxID=1386 RepID=UPI00020598D8|nr:hypothetical protein [Bacillus amyloliquefaciens]AEB23650.1 hypothetical protein BAMTA208_07385 [Bacillus amyloliquefaciens TA208]AEB63664.1 hypothetical protein LL3_02127 [Bacillus amyloliquefaciens LL3]AEK88639.1 hypothetical protein BAXH7_01501 [Bacillus amyloliquefaciens XH7]AIW33920.1 hypothetical protein KS08_09800 [Bacillus subtilis]KYC95941.1 hypothetical protein B425_2797 [Bacillus amyloliquefaciens]